MRNLFKKMHPKKKLLKQNLHPEERKNDAPCNVDNTTTEYECDDCGGRKFTVTYFKMQGDNEPERKRIVCTICTACFIL